MANLAFGFCAYSRSCQKLGIPQPLILAPGPASQPNQETVPCCLLLRTSTALACNLVAHVACCDRSKSKTRTSFRRPTFEVRVDIVESWSCFEAASWALPRSAEARMCECWLCLLWNPTVCRFDYPSRDRGPEAGDSRSPLCSARCCRSAPLCSALLRSGRDVVLVFEIELQGFRPQSRRSFSKLFEASELRLRRSKLERRKGHANFVIRL